MELAGRVEYSWNADDALGFGTYDEAAAKRAIDAFLAADITIATKRGLRIADEETMQDPAGNLLLQRLCSATLGGPKVSVVDTHRSRSVFSAAGSKKAPDACFVRLGETVATADARTGEYVDFKLSVSVKDTDTVGQMVKSHELTFTEQPFCTEAWTAVLSQSHVLLIRTSRGSSESIVDRVQCTEVVEVAGMLGRSMLARFVARCAPFVVPNFSEFAVGALAGCSVGLEIGHGLTSRVFKFGSNAVVKLVSSKFFELCFAREIAALKICSSLPNVPHLLSEPAGVLIMEFLERPPCWYLEFAVDAIHGLHSIHSLGVVHGDIRPDNVLFRRAGQRAVICDFGFSLSPGITDLEYARVGGFCGGESDRSVRNDWKCMGQTVIAMCLPMADKSRIPFEPSHDGVLGLVSKLNVTPYSLLGTAFQCAIDGTSSV